VYTAPATNTAADIPRCSSQREPRPMRRGVDRVVVVMLSFQPLLVRQLSRLLGTFINDLQ